MTSAGNYTNNDSLTDSNAEGVLLSRPPVSNTSNERLAMDSQSANASAISWGAIVAGTVVAAALSLSLVILGIGLGMSSASVFSGQGLDATTLGITTIVWLALTQIIAYGMGGYLAGRLRTKWVSVHTDEVYFRDTAHGFITWALSSLLCATLLASAIGSIVGGAARMGGSVISGAATATMAGAASTINMDEIGDEIKNMSSNSNPLKELMGSLFRKSAPAAGSENADDTASNARNTNTRETGAMDETAEVASILMNNMNASTLPASDAKYLAQIVSEQTGLSLTEAEERVTSTFTQMQQKKTDAIAQAKITAEKARKTAAYTALCFFGFLLVGAFSASLAATWGGKKRDL